MNKIDEIDIVYRWINPEIGISKLKIISKEEPEVSIAGTNNIQRYRDNNELKYSLRSVSEYAKWIRTIHILGEGPPPNWLNIADPIAWIDLNNFLRENDQEPQPNSELQKLYFSKIQNLAEKFICFDDDWFLGQEVTENDFFAADGRPIQPRGDHAPVAWTKTLYDRGLSMLPPEFVKAVRAGGTSRMDPNKKMQEFMRQENLLLVSENRDAHIWLRDVNVANYKEILQEIENRRPVTYCINDDWSTDGEEYLRQMDFLQQFFEKVLPKPAPWEHPKNLYRTI